ncbi:sigma 54-interacting transcriptional regulator [Proteiniborus sp. MB09-C3]|uniref:sigma 54-interacting transcriptional regulator n=1 Tax=Proteiniborus sp. MB09-C3 TaxID=3050072 RepID=UPI0025542450|nr:sigma 54-interacting transcriptional regulator [Proteiniborus sp. MB09-C3]WIV12192.1 sigma 54-interacting transcriptional regulator [Proteiniborus sp. MB09-C3]
MEALYSGVLDNRKITLNHLQIIIDNIFDGTAIEIKGKIVFCNEPFENLMNLKRDDIINKPLDLVFKDEELVRIISESANIEKKEISIGKKQVLIKNNTVQVNDGATANILVFKDITMENFSKAFSRELNENLELLGDLYSHAYHGMAIVDDEGKIIKWDYEELLGYKEEEVLGKYAPDVIENTRLHIVAKTGKKEICDLQMVNGRYLITSRIPIIRDGKAIGAVGTVFFKNVEELKILANKIDSLENTVNKYKSEISRLYKTKYSFDDIITKNKEMLKIRDIARKAARSNSTVLIQGESGTGKEFFAHSIHNGSQRKYGPFVTINCAAIPRELLESELFGYEEGAFTGAKKHGKMGKFELANGGSILLDEIGSMPIEMQAKLLRVLEAREFERVGGTSRIEMDVRIIASTNESLEEQVKSGKFRQDLFYRLNVIRIEIPPLRDRLEDIPILSQNILGNLSRDLMIGVRKLSTETIHILMKHDWPGNVRELRNAIERAINIASGDTIYPEYLPDYILEKADFNKHQIVEGGLLRNVVAKAEIDAIIKVLHECNDNKTLAAKKLGIHRTALYKKMDIYNMTN